MIHHRIKQKVKESINHKPNKRKKVTYLASAVVIFLGVLIGSAFISPSISNVMAEFPLIGYIFDDEEPAPLASEIKDYLISEDYHIHSVNSNFQQKAYEIEVPGGNAYFHQVKEKIQNHALTLLKEKGLDAYSVKVVPYEEDTHTPVKKSQELINEEQKIKAKLSDMGYSIGLAFYIPNADTFTIGVKEDEQTFKDNQEVVKSEVTTLLKTFHRDDYTVEIFRYVEGSDLEDVNYERWSKAEKSWRGINILSSYVEEALSSKNIPYRGVNLNYPNHTLTVSAWGFQTNAETLKAALPKKINSVDFGSYDVKVNILDREKMAKGEKARQLSRPLAIALAGQEGLHVKTVGVSLQNETFNIFVSTTLSSNSHDKDQAIAEIEKQIKEFLTSKEGKQFIEDNSYQIEFDDKNGNVISD